MKTSILFFVMTLGTTFGVQARASTCYCVLGSSCKTYTTTLSDCKLAIETQQYCHSVFAKSLFELKADSPCFNSPPKATKLDPKTQDIIKSVEKEVSKNPSVDPLAIYYDIFKNDATPEGRQTNSKLYSVDKIAVEVQKRLEATKEEKLKNKAGQYIDQFADGRYKKFDENSKELKPLDEQNLNQLEAVKTNASEKITESQIVAVQKEQATKDARTKVRESNDKIFDHQETINGLTEKQINSELSYNINKNRLSKIDEKLNDVSLPQDEISALKSEKNELQGQVKTYEENGKKITEAEMALQEEQALNKDLVTKRNDAKKEEKEVKDKLSKLEKGQKKVEHQIKRKQKADDLGNELRETDENIQASACGQYGGASCNGTQVTTTAIQVVGKVGTDLATAAMNINGAGSVMGLQSKGDTATHSDFVTTQKDILEDASKFNKGVAYFEGAATAALTALGIKHSATSKRIERAQNYELGQVREEIENKKIQIQKAEQYISDESSKLARSRSEIKRLNREIQSAEATNPPTDTKPLIKQRNALEDEADGIEDKLAKESRALEAHGKELAQLETEKSNVIRNGDAEIRKQTQQATATYGVAGAMGAQAALTQMNAKMLENQAGALTVTSGGTNGEYSNYVLNPTTGSNEGTNYVNPNDPSSAGAVSATEPTSDDNTGGGGGFDDFNQNFNNDKIADGNAGDFKPVSPSSGGVTGSGPGGAGGTSAARDSGGGAVADSGKGKQQAGGNYSGGGSSGSFARRGGGGSAGVSSESGFGDLLKSFLPSVKDEAAKKDSLALDSDRSPASDRAAVIGRNQNIFVEISKRYKKKNSEGAVSVQ